MTRALAPHESHKVFAPTSWLARLRLDTLYCSGQEALAVGKDLELAVTHAHAALSRIPNRAAQAMQGKGSESGSGIGQD